MNRTTRWIAAGALVLGTVGVSATVAGATGGEPPGQPTTGGEPPGQPTTGGEAPDQPITGDALAKASAAALTHTGGGTVTETEVGDEEGFYEVEVTRPDGSSVDVHLDANFTALSTTADTDGRDNTNGSGR